MRKLLFVYFSKIKLKYFLNFRLVYCVYIVYLCNTMAAKKTLSFKIRPELRKVFEFEAKKDSRTLSYYIEQICEDFATRKKLTKPR